MSCNNCSVSIQQVVKQDYCAINTNRSRFRVTRGTNSNEQRGDGRETRFQCYSTTTAQNTVTNGVPRAFPRQIRQKLLFWFYYRTILFWLRRKSDAMHDDEQGHVFKPFNQHRRPYMYLDMVLAANRRAWWCNKAGKELHEGIECMHWFVPVKTVHSFCGWVFVFITFLFP